MGLQYVDGTGTERTLTVLDMQDEDFKQSYYDLHKSLYGFRPGSYDPEIMLHFFDTYEARFEESEEEERQALKARSERDGIEYTSWTHYYDEQERRDRIEWEREEAERQAKLAERAEMTRRFSPLPFIEAWEHGSLA